MYRLAMLATRIRLIAILPSKLYLLLPY